MAGDKSLIQFQVLFEKKQNERKRTRLGQIFFEVFISCIYFVFVI
jgi:hypothetical protein